MILTGAEVLAEGLIRMGVRVVTGYPGSPATGVMEAYKRLAEGKDDYVGKWMINEKVSLEYALGHSLAGQRSATVLKNVGFNLIMDSLIISALTGVRAACLIILGDDPGARQSSHEEDARALAVAAEVPLLEPATPGSSPEVLRRGIDISERYGVPVVIRFTPTFVEEREEVHLAAALNPSPAPCRSSEEITGFTCEPHQAIPLHARLHKIMDDLSEEAVLSRWEGSGSAGVIAVGDSWLKVRKVLVGMGQEGIKVLRLEEVNPLPTKALLEFLTGLQKVLVVEEVLPLVEEKVVAFCYRHHLDVEVVGKVSGHLPREDVLLLGDICRGVAEITSREVAQEVWDQLREEKGGWGEGKPLCPGCPYGKILESLNRYWSKRGITTPVLAGEPGCGARMYYPPYQKLDLFLCMGSSVPLISAVASCFPTERPVAVIGESAFLNSGVPALIQACRLRACILVIIVNNYSAALTGYQPTLELGRDELEECLQRVVQGAGPAYFASVSEEGLEGLDVVISKAHRVEGPSVILVNAPCPEIK